MGAYGFTKRYIEEGGDSAKMAKFALDKGYKSVTSMLNDCGFSHGVHRSIRTGCGGMRAGRILEKKFGISVEELHEQQLISLEPVYNKNNILSKWLKSNRVTAVEFCRTYKLNPREVYTIINKGIDACSYPVSLKVKEICSAV